MDGTAAAAAAAAAAASDHGAGAASSPAISWHGGDRSCQVTLRTGQSVSFVGELRCSVASGSAHVFGCVMTPLRPAFRLYSPEFLSSSRLTIEHAGSSVAVLRLDSTGIVDPEPRCTFKLMDESARDSAILPGMYIPSAWRDLADTWEREGLAPGRLLIHGPRCSGKSTLSRYIVNRMLNRFEQVVYLDLDIGQCEFTPNGMLSVVRIDRPLLGPAYTHQQETLLSIHFGDLTAATNMSYYVDAVEKLTSLVTDIQQQTGCPCVINTMGWIDGLGCVILQKIMDICRADYVVQISSTQTVDAETAIDDSQFLPKYNPVALHKFLSPVPSTTSTVTAADYRTLSLASYMTHHLPQCLNLTTVARTITQMPFYSISFDDIRVWFQHEQAPVGEELRCLNLTLVGLCVEATSDDAFPNCIALAIVRSVDPVRRMFHIATPVPREQLEQVTVMVRGVLSLPAALIFQDGDSCVFSEAYAQMYSLNQAARSNAMGALEMKSRSNVRRN